MNPAAVAPALVDLAPWLDQLLLVGVASARFAFAFLFVPLFNEQVMPPLVRNSLIVGLGLVVLNLQVDFLPQALGVGGWLMLFLKEAFCGLVIGFFFGTILWAIESAGELIDTKVGATQAQLSDPLSGTTTSLTGVFLARFAQTIFATAGGITLLVGMIMESYALWPMGPQPLRLDPGGVMLFEGEFGRLFALAALVAAPVLVMLYVIDLGMGLLNRFAPQFNVFILSMPIKSVAATIVLLLLVPLLGQAVIAELGQRPGVARAALERVR